MQTSHVENVAINAPLTIDNDECYGISTASELIVSSDCADHNYTTNTVTGGTTSSPIELPQQLIASTCNDTTTTTTLTRSCSRDDDVVMVDLQTEPIDELKQPHRSPTVFVLDDDSDAPPILMPVSPCASNDNNHRLSIATESTIDQQSAVTIPVSNISAIIDAVSSGDGSCISSINTDRVERFATSRKQMSTNKLSTSLHPTILSLTPETSKMSAMSTIIVREPERRFICLECHTASADEMSAVVHAIKVCNRCSKLIANLIFPFDF